jgi:outer membrane protein, multidrug efflux system
MNRLTSVRFVLPIMTAAVLSACSLAPVYKQPAAPIATVYPEGASTGVPASASTTVSTTWPTTPAANKQAGSITADSGWREFFTDPRLQGLVEASLENNRDLRTAALRIEEARAQYGIIAADTLPSVGGTVTGSRGRTSSATSPTGASIVGSSYQVGLTLSAFELDFFGRVRSLNEAALSQYLATEEARNAVQISLVAEVAKAYLTERALAEQEDLARRTLTSRESAYKFAQQRFDVGASSALDLRQNEILVQTARASLATLVRQRAQALNALTLLVGRPLSDLPEAAPFGAQQLVAELPAGLPSDLLTRRPDIRASELRLKASNANIGAARAAFFPRISLTAGLGSASGELSGLFEAGTHTWSFVPQLVLPIFDAGRNRANLNLAEVRNNIAVVDYEKSIQAAFREVSDALVARSAIDEQIDAQNRVVEAQRERLRLADLRYQNGVASSLDLLDAQRELFSAEQVLVQARLLRLTNATDLYRALGGGLKS